MLQGAWYSNAKWVWLLSPLTAIFWLLSALRRRLFEWGWLKSNASPLPLIIVGNISVGGNGKTPLTISLVEKLREHGYTPAVLSRGYGGSQTQFPYKVTPNCTASLVGDEPALISKRLACDVIIDPKRARACQYIAQHTQADVIICDDGLQHYALQRTQHKDVELCVLDKRGIGNGYLLPMGPLREGKWRLSTVDACVSNIGFDKPVKHSIEKIVTSFTPKANYQMQLQACNWVNVRTGQSISIQDFPINVTATHAIAGIGDPRRFFDSLDTLGIAVEKCIAFADHYAYSIADIPTNERVLMTEKDAVKCAEFAHEDCWYLQISATIEEGLFDLILQKLRLFK